VRGREKGERVRGAQDNERGREKRKGNERRRE
jgi:hypothetical protein